MTKRLTDFRSPSGRGSEHAGRRLGGATSQQKQVREGSIQNGLTEWRRQRQLEAEGFIYNRVKLKNSDSVNLGSNPSSPAKQNKGLPETVSPFVTTQPPPTELG